MGPQDWTELVLHLAAPSQADWVALEHGDEQMTIKQLAAAPCSPPPARCAATTPPSR